MLALAKVGAKPLGNAPADNRGVNTPSQVICPLDVLLRYHSRAAHAVGKSTGADVTTWLITNDEAEMAIWVDKMVNSDGSLGQIIASTMKERAEAWRAPQSTHSQHQPNLKRPNPFQGFAERISRAKKGKGKGGKQGGKNSKSSKQSAKDAATGAHCLAFQEGKCAWGKDCKYIHTCSKMIKGWPCGSTHHGSKNCPR